MISGPVFEDVSTGDIVLLALGGLLAAVAAFLLGAVNPASILARVLGKDLRSGSGNPGATNAGRVLGVRWGVVVGVLDVLKGAVPVWLTVRAAGGWVASVVGLLVVLGHIWSPYLKGRGGKGVATTFGVVLAVAPWTALVLAVVFGLTLLATRWMAGASIAACVALVAVGSLGRLLPSGVADRLHPSWVFVVLGLVVLSRHRSNVRGWLAARRVARG